MKTNLSFVLIPLVAFSTMAQTGINYKAVIKDGSGNIVANQLVQIQFSILEGATTVYTEMHVPTTTSNGLVILNIGLGTTTFGTFSSIKWGNGNFFLNVQVNTGGGLQDLGTTQFRSVPYALSSADRVFEKDGVNAYKNTGNIGIGTTNPLSRFNISDATDASILLQTPTTANITSLRLENGAGGGTHTFFKLENRSNLLRFSVDSNLTLGTGYNDIVTIGTDGKITQGSILLNSGATINEFSTDVTLSGNSNVAVPTENAVKTYVDNAVAGGTKTLVIPGAAFTGNQSGTSFINYKNDGNTTQFTSGNTALIAPIFMPAGTEITSITFYLRDNTNVGNVNLRLELLRVFKSNTSKTIMFSITTFAISFEETYSTPFTILDDNQYMLSVQPTSTWGTADFGINSVKITYNE